MSTASQTARESIALRRAVGSDGEFLFGVYASTRTEELAQVPWDGTQREAFMRMQFDAQRRYYEAEYPGAEFDLILVGGRPAGRLYLHRREREIRVMDITLLPEFRRHGIGTALLEQVLAEGAATERSVTIHVEVFNPARRLYERLGFQEIANTGVHILMERSFTTAENSPTRTTTLSPTSQESA